MADRAAIRARDITKCFGEVVALDGVDIEVAPGRIHGLVGPNGAGKTTLLGLLLGLATADSGTLEVLGTPVGPGVPLPAGVAGFVDGPGLYPALTARQNLRATARLRGTDQTGIAAAIDRVGLTDVIDDRVRGFSLGMRQRLGLAAALLISPRLLVLDEPANGLDPAGARHVRTVLADLAAAGTAVVLSSHRMDDLAALCHEVTLLNAGQVVFCGPVDGLVTDEAELDYRVRTNDPTAARDIARGVPGLTVRPADAQADVLLVRGAAAATDELVVRLVGAGIAVRELAPVISPLEAGFLRLTGGGAAVSASEDVDVADVLDDVPANANADADADADADRLDAADARVPQGSRQ